MSNYNNVTFPTYHLIGLLNSMGWPKKTGSFIKKETVNRIVLFVAVQALVKTAIALGTEKPDISINLLANLFGEKDWPHDSTQELWDKLDPNEKICNDPNKTPEKIIAPTPLSASDKPKSFVDWKFIFQEEFQLLLHWSFGEGLVWGLNHPKDAIVSHEKSHQEMLNLPESLRIDIGIQPVGDLQTLAGEAEDVFNSFQQEIHPLVLVPEESFNLSCAKEQISQLDFAKAYYMLGNAYGILGRYEEAIKACKTGLR